MEKKNLLPIGTLINYFAGFKLRIIGYNPSPSNSLYNKERYPYKCRRTSDNYVDYYGFQHGENTILQIPGKSANKDINNYFLGED